MTPRKLVLLGRIGRAWTPAPPFGVRVGDVRSVAKRSAAQIEGALLANLTLEEKLAASIAVAELRAGKDVRNPPCAS